MLEGASGDPSPSAAPARRTLSRRGLLIAAAGVATAAAVGIPTAVALSAPTASRGRLVTPMLGMRPFTIAHHGGSLDWPEMSMLAYRNAVATGVDALEMSLARTSDGVWFGLHDSTLDRTSGTTNFVPSQHTWAEVKAYRISGVGTSKPTQATQPYARVEEVLSAFSATHTIFLDPKAAAVTYYPELLAIVERLVTKPQETVVAKGYCTTTGWGKLARSRGYQSWGYYYASEIAASATLIPTTHAAWSLVGLDAGGAAAQWTTLASLGKPVIGHVVQTVTAAKACLTKGARGLMISGVSATMPYAVSIQ